MKLGFVLLFLTCALLFPRPIVNPACINKCQKTSLECAKAAKTDADKKACQKAEQECVGVCNKK
jgi:hypothetical protein